MAKTQYEQRYSKYVHYFCHVDSGKLVYPKDTDDNYSTYGSFFLIGGSVKADYIIHAYDNGIFTELTLTQDERNSNFFVATHKKYGKFVFHAEQVEHWNIEVNYNQKSYSVLRRLRPWNESKFESVCKMNDFYIVGFANLDDGEQ
ncbi:hypothetical protein ACP54H_000006 [Vibrio alginolyticus]